MGKQRKVGGKEKEDAEQGGGGGRKGWKKEEQKEGQECRSETNQLRPKPCQP